jgi:putative transposase
MPNYRRVRIPGGTYSFTVNLLERRRTLLVDRFEALRDSFRVAHAARPFALLAWVILPDHLHCVWRLPEGDDDNATRWRHIKSRFSRAIQAGERLSERRQAKAERGIWQRRYWERVVRDEDHLRRCIDYVHINPQKHGHVECTADWPHSSFHRYVKAGLLPADWAGEIRKAD